MSAPAASWRLDRLSTSARDAAEIASLGAGMSLSSWLARLIGETCAAEGVAPLSETPKIIEFTRDTRDRTRPTSASLATPDPAATQPSATPAPPQSPQTAAQPILFRPPPIPTPVPPPAPIPSTASNVVMPFTTPRSHTQASQTQAAPSAPAQIAAPAAIHSQKMAPAATAAPSPTMPPPALQSAPAPTAPPGATMLAIEAIVSANLGSRCGETIPEPLLADIAIRGVREPIRVRRSAANTEQYEIICGHRRWRAAQRVGLAHVPAIVESQDDSTAILSSLAENLETGTLSVLDEAQTYLRLLTQCAVDASVVTAEIGRDRKHIVQSMRLLGLPPLVRHLIGAGMLSREHAFLLLEAPSPEVLADAILAENLDVDTARRRLSATESGP